jgi:hypothetical protein
MPLVSGGHRSLVLDKLPQLPVRTVATVDQPLECFSLLVSPVSKTL